MADIQKSLLAICRIYLIPMKDLTKLDTQLFQQQRTLNVNHKLTEIPHCEHSSEGLSSSQNPNFLPALI